MKTVFSLCLLIVLSAGCGKRTTDVLSSRPNILFVITDDQSWEHAGVYGDQALRTPSIDRLAAEGVLFENAYCPAPSCSPSRAGILTGQDIFRLEEGGVLTGYIRKQFEVFPLMLEEAGYAVGSTGKPYWPRTPDVAEAWDSPTGTAFRENRMEVPRGLSRTDYAADFDDFLSQVPEDQPFFFWVGISEPHLPHPAGLGISTGIDTSKVRIPAFWPDKPEIRLAMSDYMAEIEWADAMFGRMVESLEREGLAANTLVVFTSDNGMPFPRAKATLYDHGVRMPLIVKWDGRIEEGGFISDPVSLIDMAPTFLELAGIDVPDQMTGQSINGLLFDGISNDRRDFVVTVFEKHVLARPDSMGFPRRALHTEEWTYIRNYEPDRWPAGNEDYFVPGWDFYGDIDPSAIKTYLLDNRERPEVARSFELAFGRVPAEELYNKRSDPDMVVNLASAPQYTEIMAELRGRLEEYLREMDDPRMRGESPWDDYNLDH